MSEQKIMATLSAPIQIGVDVWKQHYTSRVFDVSRPINDMLSWAEAEGFKNPTISYLQLTEQPESAISIIEQSLKDCHPDLAEYLEVYGTIHKLKQAE